MKGVIFNVIEEVITARFGAGAWDDLLDEADLAGAYTSLGNYDDAELSGLVAVACRAFDLPTQDVLRLIGSDGFTGLARRYPGFLEGHTSSRTVLADLNNVIHPQVLTLYPGATVPEFDFRMTEHQVELVYRSGRGLCHLAEGLAGGAAQFFGETVSVAQPWCRHRGDGECVIVIEYGVDG